MNYAAIRVFSLVNEVIFALNEFKIKKLWKWYLLK